MKPRAARLARESTHTAAWVGVYGRICIHPPLHRCIGSAFSPLLGLLLVYLVLLVVE